MQMKRAEIKKREEERKRKKNYLILFEKSKENRPSYDYFLSDNLLSFLNWKDPFFVH